MRGARTDFAPTASTGHGKGPRTRRQVQALRHKATASARGEHVLRSQRPVDDGAAIKARIAADREAERRVFATPPLTVRPTLPLNDAPSDETGRKDNP